MRQMKLPSTTKFYHAVIMGAGPVGLLLAHCLRAFGLSFLMLERRKDRRSNGRVVVLHPALMELLERLDLQAPLLAAGTKVALGRAFRGDRRLGEVSFAGPGFQAGYRLSLPQFDLERILEAALLRACPDCLFRETGIETFQNGIAAVKVRARFGVTIQELNAGFLVGTDGPRSAVRAGAGLALSTLAAPDAFAQGDFDDVGGFADEHRIFVDDLGLIETLPLPGSHRRWMVQTPGLVKNPDESSFLAAIQARTGLDLTRRRAGLLTGVEVPRYLADSFHKGRAALAGDAAHSVTPLGGRGLNQAFLDARDLAGAIHHVSQAKAAPEIELGEYTRRARARAEAADQWAANALAGLRAGGRPWLGRFGLKMVRGLHVPNPAPEYFASVEA